MILAMLLLTARVLRRRRSEVVAILAFAWGLPAVASAQGVEGGYLPSGGGSFVPFRGGPAGGLGVMPSGPRPPGPGGSGPAPAASRFMGPGMGPAVPLGSREGLAPLRPIGLGGGMGLGSGPLVPRPPSAMKAMPRPAVGSYPFRVPPSLRGGGASRPAMAM